MNELFVVWDSVKLIITPPNYFFSNFSLECMREKPVPTAQRVLAAILNLRHLFAMKFKNMHNALRPVRRVVGSRLGTKRESNFEEKATLLLV